MKTKKKGSFPLSKPKAPTSLWKAGHIAEGIPPRPAGVQSPG